MLAKSLSFVAMFSLAFCAAPLVQAGTLSGDSILVTSTFDSDPSQQWDFADITATRTDAGVFSDWMYGPDAGTNITIIPGTPNGDQTRNEFDINFSGNTFYDNFTPTDTLTFTLQLSPDDDVFNINFFALTIANDVQVPASSADGGTFTFELTNLDQIDGNGGKAQFIFDVEQAPEPGTVLLVAIGSLALLIMRRKYARKAQSESRN